jgi:Asp-tRNA(Asn)/Glu-tRNA(Gln) amidotransferase A subunit family amidase
MRHGRISRYGAMGLSWTMDKIGPICRGVEDCAIVLHACYGPDGRDRSVAADPFHWEPRKPLSAMKIGILQKDFDRFTGDVKKVYDQALADLQKAGVKMTPVEFPEDGPTLRFLLTAEAAAAFDDITRDGQVRNLRGQTPNTFRTSRLVPAVEYIRAQRARTLLVRRFEHFMADWDAIVMPPNSLLTTTNLTGNPQVVMKCGFTETTRASDGAKIQVPRSISFLGRIYDEGSPLRVALRYERVTAWHRKYPTLVA